MSTPEGSLLVEKNEDPSASKGLVKRAVDRLGRSRSIGNKTQSPNQSQGQINPPPRRIFSLSRKGKSRDRSGVGFVSQEVQMSNSQPTLSRATMSPISPTAASQVIPADDSPFIRPPSPTTRRSFLQTFRGDGSMRAGTQTLIQALQAIPWAEDQDHDDDIINHSVSPAESDSEPEEKMDLPMTSSLHTIHRPAGRSQRADASGLSNFFTSTSESLVEEDEEEDKEEATSSSETDDADFEVETPRMPSAVAPYQSVRVHDRGRADEPAVSVMARSGSMATVRLQRRARLADKLKDIFQLEGIEEVFLELPCWLLRSVLLQGYMYLTNTHLCFFAHMPTKENQVLKSGSLAKKAQRTKRWIKHWFVLKNDVLSWYQSSSDPYFPHGMADLRYALSCEAVKEREIRIRTNQKTVLLSADSVPSRDEWVKAIRRVMFKAQNMGDTVKIAIPYSAILDVDQSAALDFSETIEVKVIDKDEHSVESYFFAYFHDLPAALDQIRDVVRNSRTLPQSSSPQPVMDTTMPPRTPSSPNFIQTVERTHSLPVADQISRAYSAFRLPSIWPMARGTTSPEETPENEEFMHISKRKSGSSFIPFTGSPTSENVPLPPSDHDRSSQISENSARTNHTYPPHPLPELYQGTSRDVTNAAWTVPTWLRVPSRKIITSPFSSSGPGNKIEHGVSLPATLGSVSETYSSVSTPGSASGELGFSILDAPGSIVDPQATEKFHSSFAFDDRETLLGYFPGYIYRILPLSGRLYISTNYFCYKSTGPLSTRTRMILPIRDILSIETSKAFHFGHHGLILIVKGYEELFFEFGLEDRRTAFMYLLEKQMEDVRRRAKNDDNTSPGGRVALILEGFDSRSSLVRASEPRPSMGDSLPAVMFHSTSSTFLTFKPKESLHFTFLTIGSRGDVQPYISLAKGLMADGHRVRIATHGEFKDWIVAHGIEFGYVGGDPAELMRICVENGTFTVSFLKEGLQKFRGWLDDLLKTSWEACQGTDVLIESPSAMAGYHIAEALGIPYFRAFTMTWTRTRAYPHAFAVPERKMGGSYNYMTYVVFDQVFWRAISGQINRWRRNLLKIGSTSLDKMEPHKIPFLYNFSPVLVPPPLDWPEWIRVTGYWFLNEAEVGSKNWTPPPDLVDFIDSAHSMGKKVVYIGFGSIVVSDPKTMSRTVVDAIVKSGVHAILSKGWSDRLQVKNPADIAEVEEPLPKQIYSISSLPHDWLFQRIDAACHHGGAGTTGASLRAGIPTIIKPFFGDQFFWADRVEALGIGSGVRKLTVEHLTEALVAATTDEKQIARARVVGEQIRAENGVATAVEAIYRDLEYARSLVKRSNNEDENATIRDHVYSGSGSPGSTPERSSTGESSSESVPGASSEDWSVISDGDERRTSFSARRNSQGNLKPERPSPSRRSSLSAAVMSVMPNSLKGGNASATSASGSR